MPMIGTKDVDRKAEFGIMDIFIGARALNVDHGAKSPEEAPFIERFTKVWTQRFQSLGPDLPKAEFKMLRTDRDDFIKREMKVTTAQVSIEKHERLLNLFLFRQVFQQPACGHPKTFQNCED
jgi:hypothetical protein